MHVSFLFFASMTENG